MPHHKRRKKEGKGMIKSIIRTFIINALALYFISQYIPGFHLNEGIKTLLLISCAFTVLHVIIRPISDAILGGLNFLTFGLLGLVIDAAILFALSRFFPQITLSPWHFAGASVNGFNVPPYNFNEFSTIALVSFLINTLQTAIHLLV